MKKILLTLGFAAATLAASAQGISTTAAYDDFAKLDFYSVATEKLNVDSAAVNLSADAYMGVFWGKSAVVGGLNASFVRNTTTKTIDYTISTAREKYDPIWMGFGDYVDAIGDTKKPFTLDLSKDATLSLTVKNTGDSTVRFAIQVQDINDSVLVYLPSVLEDPKPSENFWKYNIGAVQGESNPVEPGTFQDLSFNLKDMIVGGSGNRILSDAPFDFTKVKAFLFTVVNHNSYNGDPSYDPKPLVNQTISISNLKIGDVATIAGIVDTEYASNSNLVWSAYDMMGTYVGANKYNDLVAGLENGKVYVLRAGNNVIKIVK